jgi:photosystem II stability/assembly factor-like uncharacterized protein
MQKEKFVTTLKVQYTFVIWILSFLIMLLNSETLSQWERQSPVPTHLDLRGIAAPGTNHVFIATDNNSFDNSGSLFESADGGNSWIQRDVPFSLNDPFNGLYFLDSLNGWAYGNDNYRTNDGGTTWTQLPFLGSTYFMKFYTMSFGNANGNFGRMVSYNGGTNWEISPHEMFAFDFVNELTGIGVSDSGLYRTADGGNTFTQVYEGSAKAVTFLSDSIAVGIVNNLYIRSANGGNTWSNISPAVNRNRLLPVSGNIILSWNRPSTFPSQDGNVSRSTDGGVTWTDLGIVIPEGIYSLTATAGQIIIAADVKGNMFRSTDTGVTWIESYNSPGPIPGYLSSAVPVFPDEVTGYFGFGSGFLIKTTDAGASWSQISSGSNQTINDIERFQNGNLLAVGDNGTVLTSNGESPWILRKFPNMKKLVDAEFIGTDAAVLDIEGQVYKSTDGGETWVTAGIKPIGLTAEDLKIISPLDWWITGSGFTTGALFHTTDGGNSWSSIPDILGSYVAVEFEGTNGWLLNTGDVFSAPRITALPGHPKNSLVSLII